MYFKTLLVLGITIVGIGCNLPRSFKHQGSLQNVKIDGSTYYLDVRSAHISESHLIKLRQRLEQAGMHESKAPQAAVVVKVSSQRKTEATRNHTGGKTGITYDRKNDVIHHSLTIQENRLNGCILMEVSKQEPLTHESHMANPWNTILASL